MKSYNWLWFSKVFEARISFFKMWSMIYSNVGKINRTNCYVYANKMIRCDLWWIRLENDFHCGKTYPRYLCFKAAVFWFVWLSEFFVTGLLGNCNGDPSDDIQNREGTIILPLDTRDEQIFPVAKTCEFFWWRAIGTLIDMNVLMYMF